MLELIRYVVFNVFITMLLSVKRYSSSSIALLHNSLHQRVKEVWE